MMRHTAHSNILAVVLASLGQRNIQRFRRCHSIVKEHLVKVAHAIKQERLGVIPLNLKILRHHWRHSWLGSAHRLIPPNGWGQTNPPSDRAKAESLKSFERSADKGYDCPTAY